MPPESEGGVFIPVHVIYDKLTIAIAELSRVTDQMEAAKTDSEDKEKRIRALERWKYAAPVSNVIAIASLVVSIARSTGK